MYRYCDIFSNASAATKIFYLVLIQGDPKVSVHLMITVQKHAKIF
jgi:hypothetical protein